MSKISDLKFCRIDWCLVSLIRKSVYLQQNNFDFVDHVVISELMEEELCLFVLMLYWCYLQNRMVILLIEVFYNSQRLIVSVLPSVSIAVVEKSFLEN